MTWIYFLFYFSVISHCCYNWLTSLHRKHYQHPSLCLCKLMTLCLNCKTKFSDQSSDTIRGAIKNKLSTCSLRCDLFELFKPNASKQTLFHSTCPDDRLKGSVHPKMTILSCRSKPVKPLFIFRTQIKIFFMKS